MPQINMFLDDEANEIVVRLSKEFILSKPETINKIIKEFDKDGNTW